MTLAASEITQVTGEITQRYDNEKNVVLELNGQRYSDFEGKNMPPEAQKGVTVTFPMIEKGVWKNMAGAVLVIEAVEQPGKLAGPVEVVGQGIASTVTSIVGNVDARQRMIIRQACVKAASSFHSDTQASKEDVVVSARYFESYADGSLDQKELDEALSP